MAQLSSPDVPTSLASICCSLATDDGVPAESILLAGGILTPAGRWKGSCLLSPLSTLEG